MFVILLIVSALALSYQPYQSQPQNTPTPRTLELPQQYLLQPTPLNPQEAKFFTSNQAVAQKYRFTVPGSTNTKPLNGSMVLVWSRAWKTHHVPENCYLSQGYSISEQGVWQTGQFVNLQNAVPNTPAQPELPVTLRYLQLSQPLTNAVKSSVSHHSLFQQTGVYWFQSATTQTPDYSARVMANLFHPGQEWVMTSVLWDQVVEPQQITPFIHALQQSIRDQLHEH